MQRRAQYKKVCCWCGNEYMAVMDRAMYCSESCRREADKKRKRDRTGVQERSCLQCGNKLPSGKHKYCSEKCMGFYTQGSLIHSEPVLRVCEECGKEYIGSTRQQSQKYCSQKCRDRAKSKPVIGEDGLTPRQRQRKEQAEVREKKRIEKQLAKEHKRDEEIKEYYKNCKNEDFEYVTDFKTCESCGELFFIAPYQFTQKYCSDICNKRNSRKKYNNAHGRVVKRVKSISQIKDKDITLKKVYEIDDGFCYLCGGSCDWNDYSYVDGADGRKAFVAGFNYPSVDHVLPLASGGEHSWNNVRLAHFRCNSLKSDSLNYTQCHTGGFNQNG